MGSQLTDTDLRCLLQDIENNALTLPNIQFTDLVLHSRNDYRPIGSEKRKKFSNHVGYLKGLSADKYLLRLQKLGIQPSQKTRKWLLSYRNSEVPAQQRSDPPTDKIDPSISKTAVTEQPEDDKEPALPPPPPVSRVSFTLPQASSNSQMTSSTPSSVLKSPPPPSLYGVAGSGLGVFPSTGSVASQPRTPPRKTIVGPIGSPGLLSPGTSMISVEATPAPSAEVLPTTSPRGKSWEVLLRHRQKYFPRLPPGGDLA